MDFMVDYAEQLKRLKENENNLEFYRELASCRGASVEAKEKIDDLFLFAQENDLYIAKAWAYYCMGWYNFDKSQYENAIECFLASNDIFESSKSNDGLVYACNGLTNVYCQIGQFKLANEWGLKGISLCEETGNTEALVVLLINTSINYIEMKHFSNAKEIFGSLELLAISLSDVQQIACNLSLAEIELNIGEPKMAFSYIENALKIENKLNITSDMCEILKLRGMSYVKLYLYDLAEQEFINAYAYAVEHEVIYEKCRIMVEYAKLHLLTGRKYNASELLNEVIKICKDKDFKVLLKDSYHILYTIYKDLNMSNEALLNLENYISIDDEMYDYEQNQLMAKMNMKHTKREADKYKSLYDKTELLSTIGQKIISNLNLESIIDIIYQEINKLMITENFGIALFKNETDEITYYFTGEEGKFNETVYYNDVDDNSFGAYCIKNKRDIIIGNLNLEYNKYYNGVPNRINASVETKKTMNSIIYTPMIINDKVVGLMTVQSHQLNAYKQNDLNTLKIIAIYTAIAIENAISYKKVEDVATYDNLTKFLTKFEIMRLGEIIYNKYIDSKQRFCVTMIDIDYFKKVNDRYGHVNGDKVLRMVAQTISKCIRNTDYIGRYGGDEFLLICPGVDEYDAIEVAERIRRSVENKRYDIGNGFEISITISLGVHEITRKDQSFIDAVNAADRNLYEAKDTSRNLVICG